MKGEVKRGEVVQECTHRGEMREKGWEEMGPKAHSKNSDFSTPLI